MISQCAPGLIPSIFSISGWLPMKKLMPPLCEIIARSFPTTGLRTDTSATGSAAPARTTAVQSSGLFGITDAYTEKAFKDGFLAIAEAINDFRIR